jgi:argininosuccinate lyase
MSGLMWGGRFERGPHPDMLALTRSIDFDIELLPHDCAATRAHARTLLASGLLEADDVSEIDRVLTDLVARWERGEVSPLPGDEDVHTLVERVLTEELGDLGRRIHAGRSRNDLVATDLRLWCRSAASGLGDLLRRLIASLADFGDAQAETVMPGYTHLQRAQPVSMGYHMLAHGWALLRDLGRFRVAYGSAGMSVLGAGALAGNTLELDPSIAASELGLDSVFENAMDAVSDRDFAADLLYACASCAVHLSRLAEEIVLWTSSEFGFARLADEWSTGSSMMPQKRNPDLAELTRGRAATPIAELTALLTLVKGLPLAYDRDLQEDKLHLFRGVEATEMCVRGATAMLGGIRFDKERMASVATHGGSWATDVAEEMVRRGTPFRVAHEEAGALVRRHEAGEDLGEEAFGFERSDPLAALGRRSSHGSSSPARVREQATRLRAALESFAD